MEREKKAQTGGDAHGEIERSILTERKSKKRKGETERKKKD